MRTLLGKELIIPVNFSKIILLFSEVKVYRIWTSMILGLSIWMKINGERYSLKDVYLIKDDLLVVFWWGLTFI